MPVDSNGVPLKRGDIVMVPCEVRNVSPIDHSLGLETVLPAEKPSYLSLHADQVVRWQSAKEAARVRDTEAELAYRELGGER